MNIVSLSGGKDSCATALIMKENNIQIDLLLHMDVGTWEFPQVNIAINQVADIVDAPLLRLKTVPFDYWMMERLVVHRDGATSIGAGWPSRQHGRWCSREKFQLMDKYLKTISDPVRFVGFAADEKHRTESGEQKRRKGIGQQFRYPLIEYGLSEEDALKLCYNYGIDWAGLYELFRVPGGRCPRLSCWCCPHQPLSSLRILRKEFPEYWAKMIDMHHNSPQKVFKGWVKDGTAKTIVDLDNKFKAEENEK